MQFDTQEIPMATGPAVSKSVGLPARQPLPSRLLPGQRPPGRRLGQQARRSLWGVLFALPALILVVALLVLPALQALYYSFTSWDGTDAQWIGLQNYTNGLFANPDFRRILLNNAIIIASVPIEVAVALAVSYLLMMRRRSRPFFRAVFFLPVALSWVVIGLTFGYLFSSRGAVNTVLDDIGLSALSSDWLAGDWTSLAALILAFSWSYLGINVVLLSTGLSTVDPSVIEAARLDGAGGLGMLRLVILPQIRRYVELALIVTMSAAITQIFGLIYTMTAGGPGRSTTTLEYALYQTSFAQGNFGQGAALGIVLFVVSLAVTALRIRSGVASRD